MDTLLGYRCKLTLILVTAFNLHQENYTINYTKNRNKITQLHQAKCIYYCREMSSN